MNNLAYLDLDYGKPKQHKKKALVENERKIRNKNKILWQHPFRAIVAGASGCGKTYWTLDKLQHKDSPFDSVLWCAPGYSLKQQKLKNFQHNMRGNVVFIDGLNQEEIQKNIEENEQQGNQTCIVLDDLMHDENKFINNLFTSGRHQNCSIIELCQRLYANNKQRTNRLNTNYFILFPFGADKSEFQTLARQINPLEYKRIIEKYNLCTDKEHGCLIIDANTHTYKMNGKNILKFRDTEFDQVFEDMADV